jgi:fido (protein-threonine AMPylation protein)
MSRYDGSDSYTYPDSDVLKNKAGLHAQSALDAFEADTTAIRLLELSEYPIPGKFDLISHRTERIRFMREEEQRLANSTKPE